MLQRLLPSLIWDCFFVILFFFSRSRFVGGITLCQEGPAYCSSTVIRSLCELIYLTMTLIRAHGTAERLSGTGLGKELEEILMCRKSGSRERDDRLEILTYGEDHVLIPLHSRHALTHA